MFNSLRTKISVGVIALIIVLLGANAGVLIQTKYAELRDDIAQAAHGFAQMATRPLMSEFQLYFESGFLKFEGAVRRTLELNEDVSKLQIVTYEGAIIYDSEEDQSKKYLGEERQVESELLPASQKIEPSYYLGQGSFAGWDQIPQNQIEQIIFPYLDESRRHEYTVLYSISYANLFARLLRTGAMIGILALVAVLIGILIARYFARTITRPLAALKQEAEKIAEGNLDVEIKVEGKDEIATLAGTFNQMTDDLAQYQAELIETEKMQHEVELAAEIQQKLLPKETPLLAHAEISALVRAADDVGGDVYDFVALEKGKLLLYVGDVTGHGVPAGLISGMTNALAYGFAGQIKETDKLAEAMNATIYPKTKQGMYVTMMLGMWEDDKRELTFTNAGHEPAIHYQAKDKKAHELEKGGAPVGMFPRSPHPFEQKKVKLGAGDTILFYTDGITEAWRNEKDKFERRRLLEALERIVPQAKSAKEIRDMIMEEVDNFRDGWEQKDDITLLVIRGK